MSRSRYIRSRLAVAIFSGTALCVGVADVFAQGRIEKADQGSVELIAANAMGEGGVLEAGLRFTLQPGWHIYWRNPGDSGGPPTARWSLPAGIDVSEFSWPTPERIPVGPLVNYGYHGDVVLPFAIRVPTHQRGRSQTFTADIRWLVCKDICVSVRSTVALTWPLDAAARRDAPAWARLIDTAKQRVPVRAPATWRPTATDTGDAFLLAVTPDQAVSTTVNFFPLHESEIEDAARQVVRRAGARLELRLQKSAQLTAKPRELVGVLTIGSGRGYVVTAPVQTRSPITKGSSQ